MIRLMRGGNGLDRLLQKRFGTGNRFTRAYLEYFEGAQNVALATEADLDRLESTRKMWFDYALTTNQRGWDLVRFLGRYKRFRGARYLDIGCGFGGSLVAAGKSGAKCVGLEIDPARAAFSRLNLADFGLPVEVLEVDALTQGIEQHVGSFDMISCNDVAEHVASTEDLIRNLARLLKPDGLAYLEVPNGECVESVACDGHFGLFGITLLERERARAYHWERFHYEYDVGDYWSLEDYYGFFRRAGLRVRLAPSLYHPARKMDELNGQLGRLEEARVEGPALDVVYAGYRARLERDLREMDEEAFRNRYLRAFWTFLVGR